MSAGLWACDFEHTQIPCTTDARLGNERRVADAVERSVKMRAGQITLSVGIAGDRDRDGAQQECCQNDEDGALAAPYEARYGQSGHRKAPVMLNGLEAPAPLRRHEP
jgi:hypothetical protein